MLSHKLWGLAAGGEIEESGLRRLRGDAGAVINHIHFVIPELGRK
jgi:hypothetical protein